MSDKSPLDFIKGVKKLCKDQSILYDDKKTLCDKLKKWGITENDLVDFLQDVQKIPPEGLDDRVLDSILDAY